MTHVLPLLCVRFLFFFFPSSLSTGCVSVPIVYCRPARGGLRPRRVSRQGGRPQVQAAAPRRRLCHDPESGADVRATARGAVAVKNLTGVKMVPFMIPVSMHAPYQSGIVGSRIFGAGEASVRSTAVAWT